MMHMVLNAGAFPAEVAVCPHQREHCTLVEDEKCAAGSSAGTAVHRWCGPEKMSARSSKCAGSMRGTLRSGDDVTARRATSHRRCDSTERLT